MIQRKMLRGAVNFTPAALRQNLVPVLFGSASVLWKFFETGQLQILLSDKSLEFEKLRKESNLMFGIGLSFEVASLVGQYWRFKKFTKLLQNITSLHDEAKKEIHNAEKYLQETEKSVQEFDLSYRVDCKHITAEEEWEMSLMKDYINDKLNQVKICLDTCMLNIRVRHHMEILQANQTGIFVDVAAGLSSGTLIFPQVLLGIGCADPSLLVGAAAAGALRIAYSISSSIVPSTEMIEKLQKQLDVICELGKRHKLLENSFQKLQNSVCLTESNFGTYTIYVTEK